MRQDTEVHKRNRERERKTQAITPAIVVAATASSIEK
jgi:hypothetical protein